MLAQPPRAAEKRCPLISGKTTVTVLTVTETSANHAEQIKQDNEPGTGYDGKSILQIRRIPV